MTKRRRRRSSDLGCAGYAVLAVLGLLVVLVQAAEGGNPGAILVLVLLVGAPVSVILWRWQRRHAATARYEAMQRSAELRQVDYMTGVAFEEWLPVLMKDFGYRVETTKVVGDYGGDLVLTQGSLRIVVQAKRYGGRVGQDAVRQALASKAVYDAGVAAVVTNSYFTPHATNLARANGVYLLDRSALHGLIEARWQRAPVPTQLLPGQPPTLRYQRPSPGAPDAGYLKE